MADARKVQFPHLKPSAGKSFRRQLLGSHLMVGTLGIVAVSVLAGMMLMQRAHSRRLVEQREPTARHLSAVIEGLHRSLAALRGWVVTGESQFLEERRRAWEDEITPALIQLKSMCDNKHALSDRQELGQIERSLLQLREAQWWVEDVAQTPGNHPANVMLKREITPIAESISEAITGCIELEKQQSGAARHPLLATLGDMRESFQHSFSQLVAFAHCGGVTEARIYSRQLTDFRQLLEQLDDHKGLMSSEQRQFASFVETRLVAYDRLAKELLSGERFPADNIARHRLQYEAIPIARTAIAKLNMLRDRNLRLMNADADDLSSTSDTSIQISLLVLVGVIGLGAILARFHAARFSDPVKELTDATIRMASHDLDQDIPVRSSDDFGQLTGMFNFMRRQLLAERLALVEIQERAVAASQAKSDFLANMSHEIRTPMNAIIGLTEMVLKSELDDLQRDHLTTVLQSSESLLEIINDILDFSKIEAGKLELDHTDFQVRELLGDVLKTLADRAHVKQLEMCLRVAPEVPEMLVGDPGRLRQILINLVGNAIKFTSQGHIFVDVDWEALSPPDSGSRQMMLQVHVRDTGIGIAPENLAKVFNKFQQADTSTTREFGGTGLGLSIASKLVQAMGGEINVESELGQGSTFSFTAELIISDRPIPELPLLSSEQIRGKHVLVVDDYDVNREIMEEMLRSDGMQVTIASSGPEAFELIESTMQQDRPVDLVISDVNMPEMDGYELAAKIRQQPVTADIPIVLLTSSCESISLDAARRLRIAAQLPKPVKHSQLLSLICRLLSDSESQRSFASASSNELPQERLVRPLRILLAEDSVANQKLALAMLEGMGHQIEVVDTGEKAVTAVSSSEFDLVLMDIQMPVMDGFDATTAIRQHDRDSDRSTRIVAMTAHALQGDRQRCLDAGMDDYVAKPLRPKELLAAIHRVMGATFLEDPSASSPPSPSKCDLPPLKIDWQTLLANVGDNQDTLLEIVDAYLEELKQNVQKIAQAIDQHDAVQLSRSAHQMKNALRFFGLPEAAQLTQDLEQCGSDDRLANANPIWLQLRGTVEQLLETLEQYQGSVMACASAT